MKKYVGVDYHKNYSYGVIMNEDRQILKQQRFANHPKAVADFLGPHAGADCHAVLEATRNWTVMHDWLEEHSAEVVLAHPMKVKAIAEAKIKTDKIDATILAELLRCDLIPRAHVSSPAARVIKRILRHRIFLVRVRTMLKNRIHDLMDRHPLIRSQWPSVELFTKGAVEWMRSLDLPQTDRFILHQELDTLEHLTSQIKQAEKLLAQVGQSDDRVRRLQTIPGIGPFFAMLVISEIDDIRRFASPAKLHAYAGVIPSTHSSGGRTRHGRIIKASNKYLRWAMVEAVWPAIRKDPELYRYYHRLAGRKNANTAKVATARRLLSIVYRVLTEERDYRPAYDETSTSAGFDCV